MKTEHSLMILLASLTPEEVLVNRLSIQIKEYQEAKLLNKSKEEMKQMFFFIGLACSMILMKLSGADDPLAYMEEVEKFEMARKLLDPDKG